MRNGIRKEIGSGSCLRILEDLWLPSIPPRPPKIKEGIDPSWIDMRFLKAWGFDEWNMPMINEVFKEEDANMISQLRLDRSGEECGYTWIYNHNGDFSIKSAYWVWNNKINSAGAPADLVENPSLSTSPSGR